MSETQPVSVIATVLNEAEDIRGMVESLLAQRMAAAEIVIVDGGSTDGTWEWLEAAAEKNPTLMPVKDITCSLKYSAGPIARGRNTAIARTTSAVVACADAGCTYGPEWLERISAPIRSAGAEYVLGGTYIDPAGATMWDVASAPFFGVKLGAEEPTKSLAVRSVAFTKDLWQRVGGFPEDVFLGDDTILDARVKKMTTPAYVANAKAQYHPRHTFRSALKQLRSYSKADGVLGVRPARLARNVARCVAEVAALCVVRWTVLPLIAVLLLEVYFAFRLDWRYIRRAPLATIGARLWFSLLVPWVVAWKQIEGLITKANDPNKQNA